MPNPQIENEMEAVTAREKDSFLDPELSGPDNDDCFQSTVSIRRAPATSGQRVGRNGAKNQITTKHCLPCQTKTI